MSGRTLIFKILRLKLQYWYSDFVLVFCRPAVADLSVVDLAEVQNKKLLASYLTRIENAKLTNKAIATDLVFLHQTICYFVCGLWSCDVK